ncbi:hypothetical protein AB0O31_33120 [Kitasatospora cineracea]|uniref:hypothetical protein n=1 Tax=Kitasatospora cineracea TaxID=88074 RepID=UPI0034346213
MLTEGAPSESKPLPWWAALPLTVLVVAYAGLCSVMLVVTTRGSWLASGEEPYFALMAPIAAVGAGMVGGMLLTLAPKFLWARAYAAISLLLTAASVYEKLNQASGMSGVDDWLGLLLLTLVQWGAFVILAPVLLYIWVPQATTRLPALGERFFGRTGRTRS